MPVVAHLFVQLSKKSKCQTWVKAKAKANSKGEAEAKANADGGLCCDFAFAFGFGCVEARLRVSALSSFCWAQQ